MSTKMGSLEGMKLVKDGLRVTQDKKDPSKNTYNEDNLLPLESVDVGFAAKSKLRKLGTLEKSQLFGQKFSRCQKKKDKSTT